VLYACQDYDFDLKSGLHSIPRSFGIARALLIARGFHVTAFLALLALYWITNLGVFALVGVLATAVLLIYQHRLVSAGDLSKLNAAFFTTNAFVSVILFITFGGAALLRTYS
jgi:4-hydroxybenzoate polyprenyltransferase